MSERCCCHFQDRLDSMEAKLTEKDRQVEFLEGNLKEKDEVIKGLMSWKASQQKKPKPISRIQPTFSTQPTSSTQPSYSQKAQMTLQDREKDEPTLTASSKHRKWDDLDDNDGFITVNRQQKRQQAIKTVKGSIDSSGADADSCKDLCLNRPPSRDFFIRGLPLDITEEKIKQHVSKGGIQLRFASVFKHKEGDLRTTTSARLGMSSADEDKLLDPKIWPKNIVIRPWNYEVAARKGNTTRKQQKNLLVGNLPSQMGMQL